MDTISILAIGFVGGAATVIWLQLREEQQKARDERDKHWGRIGIAVNRWRRELDLPEVRWPEFSRKGEVLMYLMNERAEAESPAGKTGTYISDKLKAMEHYCCEGGVYLEWGVSQYKEFAKRENPAWFPDNRDP